MNNFARRATAFFARQNAVQLQGSASSAVQKPMPSELSSQALRLVGGGNSTASPKAGW